MSLLQRTMMKKIENRPPKQSRGQKQDSSPLTWKEYFTEIQDIQVNNNTFRVYLKGSEGPILYLLHGGGYSALTWSLFTREITNKIKCQVVAIDIRGHGETHTTDDDDLSIENMTDDIIGVMNELQIETKPIVFIGHSMGGSLAVHCAHRAKNCIGLCVIDVVEGTALDSLASMQIFLRNRPSTFSSIEHAIQWCIRSGQTQNSESARVSMPGQIKNIASGILAASEILTGGSINTIDSTTELQIKQMLCSNSIIVEEGEESTSACNNCMKPPSNYTWRIDLSKTEVHWRGWFERLSEMFLTTPVPKLLLLANIHGLDTALTVGQMQGKFQMQVLPKCGHAIHEDLPDKVADILATYLIRQKLTVATGEYTPSFSAC